MLCLSPSLLCLEYDLGPDDACEEAEGHEEQLTGKLTIVLLHIVTTNGPYQQLCMRIETRERGRSEQLVSG